MKSVKLFKNRPALGNLEMEVMRFLWSSGESNVRDVVEKLDRPLAYTTVMTTLDRLYKKGLLSRQKTDRAFFYAPRMSRAEFESQWAAELVAGFLAETQHSRAPLVSYLVDAVGNMDGALLDELEEKIRRRRLEHSAGEPLAAEKRLKRMKD
jgi:predicted transcriptional regulator